MATINDFKVKDEDFNDLDIMSLPSRPSAAGMSAAQLQERFDAGSKQVIRPRLNALIDLLNGTEGADNIGITPIEGLSGYTVQQILLAIKLLLDDKKNTEQSDREIAQKFDASEAQALVKEISFSEGSGVFTITKYDGSVQIIDTAIEKVALDVRLDGQQFVLTLADGSEQRVDLSAFITQTEVKSSDTITLAIENGAIVARITSGSVMLSHLNAEVTAYIDAKEAAAANSAAAAKLSEQNALNSANTAKASEQAAKACQEQACSCATQAGLSRDAAKASEQAAKEYAQEAKDYSGGDFVTNTAFNQFKETVPTLDDGKLTVQQGGIYINSDTTEEDKHEARDTLHAIGLAKWLDYRSSEYDMDEVIRSGNHFAFYYTNDNTLGTPYKKGASIYAEALILSFAFGNSFGFQIAYFTGGQSMMRNLQNSVLSDWTTGFLPLDGSVTMSGNLTVPHEIYVSDGYIKSWDGEHIFGLKDRSDSDGDSFRQLVIMDTQKQSNVTTALRFMNVTNNSYANGDFTIFGEHNKPSGSYTGNGSSASRDIDTGGIGNVVSVWSENASVIINNSGAFVSTGSTSFIQFSSCKVLDGVITLTTTNSALNENGVEYWYQVL